MLAEATPSDKNTTSLMRVRTRSLLNFCEVDRSTIPDEKPFSKGTQALDFRWYLSVIFVAQEDINSPSSRHRYGTPKFWAFCSHSDHNGIFTTGV